MTTAPTPLQPAASQAVADRRALTGLWLWGVAAAVAGAVATLFTQAPTVADNANAGPEVINQLHRGTFHVGVVFGFAAVLFTLVIAAVWRRWSVERAPTNVSLRVVSQALTATAGAMMIGYGFKGSLAVYLPGGINAHMFSNQGLFSVYMLLDFGPFLAWWGAGVAAAALAWASLRDRVLPLWMGVVSLVFAVIPVALLVGTGLPGVFGIVGPLWLAIISVGMALSRVGT